MCGIAGIVHWGRIKDADKRMDGMKTALLHRGPDGHDSWSSPSCALGHVRLSILDHDGGRQPMGNEDGTVVVVYNGEIYNHRELRRELEKLGHTFRTDHSDTEVLVHGYESWGNRLPSLLNGMFAFAVWDELRRCLFLGRDRYGIKPLHVSYGKNGVVTFASEVRGIFASGLVEPKESVPGLLEYLSFQNLVTGRTMFDNVEEFSAAHYERVTIGDRRRSRYWDVSFPRSFKGTLEEAVTQHRDILSRVVRRQIEADVPITTYLSGGIDSAGVAVAANRNLGKMKAYSCVFQLDGVGDDADVDERVFSRAAATHLDVEHVELELPQDSLKESIDLTLSALEYPRMGMCYPNYLIARRVARDAKVVLSGMGGDEFHGGYLYRYQAVKPRLLSRHSLRGLLAWNWPRTRGYSETTFKNMLGFPIPERHWAESLTPEILSLGEDFSPEAVMGDMFRSCPTQDSWDLVMYVDAKAYLHGLLVLEDKLSMAHGLETRVPLLDNELVDFVLDLPWSMLCDSGTGKIVFRESVRPWVPEAIYRKPKMGFGPPDASWYKGALRSWIEDQLSDTAVRKRGIFRPAFVRNILSDHFGGVRNNVSVIWSLLSLESWCRVFGMFGGKL